jgi:quinoprotein glucose dehydrogenase
MALDASRGIVVITTGSPKPNFIGSGHRGDNLYGNCVLALDATSGKRLWHFQEIRHDIWDLDIPAPPAARDGDARRLSGVDAVAAVTKIGNTLLLDACSGKPLFPFRLRRAPASNLRGERTAAYQPDLELPQPFSRNEFSPERGDEHLAGRRMPPVLETIRRKEITFGWFRPFDEGKPVALFGIHGGAEWTGACFDPRQRHALRERQRDAHHPWVNRNERPLVDETKLPPTPAGRCTRSRACRATGRAARG